MIISGTFRDYNNRVCEVTITNSLSGDNIEIGGNIVKFARNPVEIKDSVDDTFEVIIRKSATINLITREYIGDILFANNARSNSVTIKVGSTIVFSGYVDPNTYNQPWTSPLDEFSINCIDKLSTLQYYKYKGITPNNYNTYKQNADNVTFKSILDDALNGLSFTYVLYDKSKGIASNRMTTIFNDLTISELKIIGDEPDDTWTREETLTEILKYLNLHVKQEGNILYIFDWESIRTRVTSWYNLLTNGNRTVSASAVTLLNTMHSDNNTSISIADVYNQIVLTCDVDEQEAILESPLDKDSVVPLYNGRQLYMTEYISEGSGDRARNAITDMVQGRATNYENAKDVDWYIQAMTNPKWKFYYDQTHTVESLAEYSNGEYINQWKLPKYLKEHSCVPFIFSMGNVEHKGGIMTDNSPVGKIDMKNYLVISVNGNEWDTTANAQPTENTIYSHRNMCEYTSNVAGGSFSPVDDSTINYLVFTGKILLQPIVYESTTAYAERGNYYEDCRVNGVHKTEGNDALVPLYDITPDDYHNYPVLVKSNLVKSENNDEGKYYSRKFYKIVNPKTEDRSLYETTNTPYMQPWTKDKSANGYEYNYTAAWDSSDQYSKVPVLECELIIGNKRLIETNIDIYGNSTFEWVELGQEPTETIDGVTYTITTFSLGFNPKVGDFIIGQEYDLQNTIHYSMNLDIEGTAIPIRNTDAVSGAVTFRILGPINTTWDNVLRRHPSFWKHTRWSSATHSILSHTENIIIQDFECKIVTDAQTKGDKDLVYMSDETDAYINKKDDIDFQFMTQLTTAECIEKEISQSVNLNSVINSSTGIPITGIYNKFETDSNRKLSKAEEHYINEYYLEYNQPKIIMETQLHDNNSNWRNIYTSNMLGKTFFVLSKSDNLRECTCDLVLKEI